MLIGVKTRTAKDDNVMDFAHVGVRIETCYVDFVPCDVGFRTEIFVMLKERRKIC